MASEILKRPHVMNAVQSKLEQLGMENEVRLEHVAKIAAGYTEEIVSETTSRDGSVTRTVTTRPLSPKVQLAALQRLDKLDGSEDARKAEARVLSDSLMQLSKRMMRERRVNVDSGDSGLTGAWGVDTPPSSIIPSPLEALHTENWGGPSGTWEGVFDPLGDRYTE